MKHQKSSIFKNQIGGENKQKNKNEDRGNQQQPKQPKQRVFSPDSSNIKTSVDHDPANRRHFKEASSISFSPVVDVIDEELASEPPPNRVIHDLKNGDHSFVTKEGHYHKSASTQTSDTLDRRRTEKLKFNEDFLPSLTQNDDILENPYHDNSLNILSHEHDDDASMLSYDVFTTAMEEGTDGINNHLLNLTTQMSQLKAAMGKYENRIIKVEDTLFSKYPPPPSHHTGVEIEEAGKNEIFSRGYMTGLPNALAPATASRGHRKSIFSSFKSEGHLGDNTFTLMMIKETVSTSWILGIFAYCTQMILALLVLLDQVSQSDQGTPFNIPVRILNEVRVGQFFTIIIYLASQHDILASVQNINVLHYHSLWHRVISVEENDRSILLWIKRILFPNLLMLSQGILVTVISFVLISQSSKLVDLLKDFSALMILSEVDNIFFKLARYGFLGEELAFETSLVQEGISLDLAAQEYMDSDIFQSREMFDAKRRKLSPGPNRQSIIVLVARSLCSFRSILFASLSTAMVVLLFVTVSMKQIDGTYFRVKYNKCRIDSDEIKKIGNGECDSGYLSSPFCGLDGGDCFEHIFLYPNCNLPDIWRIGDGKCDQQFDIPDCGYDQNDCCPYVVEDPRFGDQLCHGGYFNSGRCNYDRDCEGFREKFPDCPLDEIADQIGENGVIPILGDGICDSFQFYMTEECGYEGGDCSGCNVTDYGLLGDGICDGGEYNKEECLWDGSDCILEAYPNCHVDIPLFIGDGICNDDIDGYNVKDCSWDGQDCNYALERHTTQSSTLQQILNDEKIIHGPSNSVDGNRRQNGQLSITQNEYNPWWKVYLSGLYSIQAVMIYAGPESCQNQLGAGFQVEVLKAGIPLLPVLFNGSFPIGPRMIVEVPSDIDVVGNEVRISIPGKNGTVCLSEVEVYGELFSANVVAPVTNSDCGVNSNKHQDYRGDVNVTISGSKCQRWDVQLPHQHHFTAETYSLSDLTENYCRNPSLVHNGAWCYTTDADIEWEYCNIPTCA